MTYTHTHAIWPAVRWPDSADAVCAGAAAGLLSAAWGAAAGLRTSDGGTVPPCSEVCGWRAGSPVGSHHKHIKLFTNEFQSTVFRTSLTLSSDLSSICSCCTDFFGGYFLRHFCFYFLWQWDVRRWGSEWQGGTQQSIVIWELSFFCSTWFWLLVMLWCCITVYCMIWSTVLFDVCL